jgi:hypothetical protein
MPALLILLLAVATPSLALAGDASAPLTPRSAVHFASRAEGAEILGRDDGFLRTMSPLDRQLRRQSSNRIPYDDFVAFVSEQALEWTPEEIETLSQTIALVRKAIETHQLWLDLPEEIWLVKTTGAEEGNVGNYTRDDAIFMPAARNGHDAEGYLGVIYHELFHVMTRHDPGVRKPLYAIIGFEYCGDIPYPSDLKSRRITNPDAFHHDAYINVSADGDRFAAVPLTLGKSTNYTSGSLFDNLEIRLMRVEQAGDTWRAVRRGGELQLYELGGVEGYFEQIGRNTNYIIHPEEILATNFSMVLRGVTDVPNPEIGERILEVLSK